jgi:hypothetical protein
MTTTLEGCEGSASSPGLYLPPGKTRYPLYRRLAGPQGRSGQVRKISPPPPQGFGPRTVQSVASRYTDYATRPTRIITTLRNIPEERRSHNFNNFFKNSREMVVSLKYEGNSISKLQIQVATYVFELSAGNCHR